MCPNLCLPPQPITIRWGTCLNVCYGKIFDGAKSVIDTFDQNEAMSVRDVQALHTMVIR